MHIFVTFEIQIEPINTKNRHENNGIKRESDLISNLLHIHLLISNHGNTFHGDDWLAIRENGIWREFGKFLKKRRKLQNWDSAPVYVQHASVVNCSRFYFSSALNYRGTFSSFTYVSQANQMCQQQISTIICPISVSLNTLVRKRSYK